jgi:ABC-type microcin C transport system permease subunit YejB
MHPRGLGFFLVEVRGEGDLSFFFLFWVRGLVNVFFSFLGPLKKLQDFKKFWHVQSLTLFSMKVVLYMRDCMMSSCFAIASHLDNFDLKCVILGKEGL